MKQRRSVVDYKMKKGKEVDELSPILCSFIKNVPEAILVEIFPIKEIIMCKSVCKIWYHLIKMPQFTKQHFERAQPCAVVKRSRPSQVSRMLYLIEPHKVCVTYCRCTSYFTDCEHRVSLKLDTTLKTPLRNIELLRTVNGDLKTKHSRAIKKCCTKATHTLHKFNIVNSCNGFLCLSEPQSNNPMDVFNLVTGEYLNLPGTEKVDGKMEHIVCGFGYSPKLNKYKVIRMFEGEELQDDSSMFNGRDRFNRTIAETYTFGKGSWERIGNVPDSIYSYQPVLRHQQIYAHQFPVYCNGAVDWQ
ncbi:hypothetical protein LIER_20967 [Lithospermum erythrorhizon]|uniref:F-box associated beta-propeller type 3 domain-containing protein n=1 Tax=Lithospermum erythrorhizon TaxID=34254 RepID=A0AAV3QNI3_LITER